MPYTEQPGNPLKPDNLSDLRTSVRYKKAKRTDGTEYNTGYLFVNNYQRRYKMAEHKNTVLKAYAEDGKTVLASFPERDIEDGDFFFYPFNLPVGENAFITIDATPLCILNRESDDAAYVFYTDSDREAVVDVTGDLGNNKILLLSREEAVHSGKVTIGGKEYLIISDAEPVTNADGNVSLLFTTGKKEKLTFRTYPALEKTPTGFACIKNEVANSKSIDAALGRNFENSDAFAIYESTKEYSNDGEISYNELSDTDCKRYEVSVSGLNPEANEVYMHLNYVGDTAKLYSNGDILTDSFYTGQEWEIGLKRYCSTEFKGEVEIKPLFEEDKEKMYLQEWPEMQDGRACALNGVTVYTQFSILIS